MASKDSKTVTIYADGACRGNPGPGGYGSVLKYGKVIKEISGCTTETTNNRMEMKAVIEALRLLKRPCEIVLVTDSAYVIKGMTQWVDMWVRQNWLNSRKKPVQNRDLWEELLELTKRHDIRWKWVKGHDGHPENERCDQLAKTAIEDCLKTSGLK